MGSNPAAPTILSQAEKAMAQQSLGIFSHDWPDPSDRHFPPRHRDHEQGRDRPFRLTVIEMS
ncbi:MAG: hypothetical protein RLO15_11235 [Parvibaculum sp.]